MNRNFCKSLLELVNARLLANRWTTTRLAVMLQSLILTFELLSIALKFQVLK